MAQPCEHSDVRPRRTSDEFLSRVIIGKQISEIVRYSNMADYSSGELLHHGRRVGDEEKTEIRVVSG